MDIGSQLETNSSQTMELTREVCNSKKVILKKHAAIIHCSNSLTLLQRKVSNALLFNAYGKLMEEEEHTISVRQLCEIIGYQGNNIKAIKEALKNLISTVLEWNLMDDRLEEEWSASSILASINIKGSVCRYAYSPVMKRLLYSPEMYGKISMIVQSNFKSSYGLAMYENCVRYRGLTHTKWLELPLFRKLMGVPDGMYEIFRDLKRRVIDKSIEEVNTYSDMVIEPEYHRKGRVVDKLRISLRERPKMIRLGKGMFGQVPENIPIRRENDVKSKSITTSLLETFGLSREISTSLIEQYGVKHIEQKMNMIMLSPAFKQNKIKNLAGFLVQAIKENYQESSQVIANEQRKKIQEKNKQNLEDQNAERLQQDYNRYIAQQIEGTFSSKTDQEKQKLLNMFEEHLLQRPAVIIDLYKRDGIHNQVIKGLFRSFLKDQQVVGELKTFDSFIAGLLKESSDNLAMAI